MNFILLGPPGCGKGTQGEYLENALSIHRVSTGDLLRNEASLDSPLGKKLKDILARGVLVDDEIVFSLLKKEIINNKYDKGFILDGFPRNISQAHALNDLLGEIGKAIDLVLYFYIPEQTLIDRICNRYSCSHCKENYNKLFKNPKVPGICDKCGGTDFTVRADDNVDSVKVRFAEYNKQTSPLISYYEEKGILRQLDSDKNIADISKEIDVILKKLLT